MAFSLTEVSKRTLSTLTILLLLSKKLTVILQLRAQTRKSNSKMSKPSLYVNSSSNGPVWAIAWLDNWWYWPLVLMSTVALDHKLSEYKLVGKFLISPVRFKPSNWGSCGNSGSRKIRSCKAG